MKTRNIPTEAAYLREALRLELIDVSNVIAWSDGIIDESETPSYVFIDLSFTPESHRSKLLSTLEELSAQVETIDVLPLVLGLAHEKIRNDIARSQKLAKALYAICVHYDYDVPGELNDISNFDDAYSLAISGQAGSLEVVQQNFEAFTEKFKGRLCASALPPILLTSCHK